jgi:hypothetical protein
VKIFKLFFEFWFELLLKLLLLLLYLFEDKSLDCFSLDDIFDYI